MTTTLDCLIKDPASKSSFKDALYSADRTTVEAAIAQIESTSKPSKAKLAALKTKLENLVQPEAAEVIEQPSPQAQAQIAEPALTKAFGFKFSCEQAELATFLPAMSKLVTNVSHEILANNLFDVQTDAVELTVFNLSTALRIRINAAVDRAGRFTLPATLFKDLVSQLPTGQVTLCHDLDTGLILLSSAAGNHRVKGRDADEFPRLPEFNGERIEIPMSILQDAISHTEFSASGDETKQVLCGIRLESNQQKLEVASTDGHRLSFYTPELDLTLPTIGATIPSRSLSVLKSLAPGDETISMQFDNEMQTEGELMPSSYVRFESSNGNLFICRLIDGQYPNFRQLIPNQLEFSAWIPRQAFAAAVNRVALFSNANIVKMQFSEGILRIEAHVDDLGDGAEELSIQWNSKQRLDIAFNARYLAEVLKVVNGEEVNFLFNSPTSPSLIVAPQFKHLVMPVQVRS